MQRLAINDRRTAMQLSGILRLARVLDLNHGTGPHLRVTLQDRSVVVQCAGYTPLDRKAEEVAAARHLLETVIHRPVLVKRIPANRTRAGS